MSSDNAITGSDIMYLWPMWTMQTSDSRCPV